jgi:flagellar biosynthetic protein FlhB/flagellar biosynthetic protein FliR/FlhB
MSAPQVVCKAQGEMALQVLKLAKKHSILIIENHGFAEKLYQTVALNQTINSELFASAATIYKEIL